MLDLLMKRRSIRKYTEQKVEQEKVDQIMKAALLSPSSKSRRPWEFIVVTDEEIITQLSKAKAHGSTFLSGAPLAIVVLADEEKCDVWIEDTSIASTIIQLMAEHLGLGSCWIQIRMREHNHEISAEQYTREIFSLTENMRVESIIGLGYPNEEKAAYKEEDLDFTKIHVNTYF
ncbi:nitroreductase family protein [Serpentinicella sp. ANB-PHB4]|uniref:nitroreductase family protein n=1 Tax=Serpentinicella sp. ANB-PHB4 TaxID=3074076 RepID=UPI002861635E|nr:nitroreductase family protein [Serpentinicella sp. ANB-PHB4]MDR5659652.1 nitroreductase family protein [Serpentinicella sp. ANB-PHB4]